MIINPYAFGGSGPPPSGTWVPYTVQAVIGESGIPDDSTIRQVIPSAGLTPCTKVRATIRSSPVTGMVIGAVAVGIQATSGNFYDFASTPLAATFSGSAGITLPAGSEGVAEADLIVGSGDQVVVAVYMVSGRTFYGNAANGAFLSGGGNDTATVDASGYSEFSGNGFAVTKIECFVPD